MKNILVVHANQINLFYVFIVPGPILRNFGKFREIRLLLFCGFLYQIALKILFDSRKRFFQKKFCPKKPQKFVFFRCLRPYLKNKYAKLNFLFEFQNQRRGFLVSI